jgi:hypothetical protein
MVNTGLRPDESKRLEVRDVKVVDDRDSGEHILEIDVRGKRGVGFCERGPSASSGVRACHRRSGSRPASARLAACSSQRHNSVPGTPDRISV